MKKYVTTITIIFLSLFIVIGGFSYFMYQRIVDQYVNSKVGETLLDVNQTVNEMLKSQIDYNYTMIETFLENNQNATLEELNELSESLTFINVEHLYFGKILNNGLETNDKVYEYQSSLVKNLYILDKYYIINFSAIYNDAENAEMFFLRFSNDFVAFFDANNFLMSIFQNAYELNNKSYLIMGEGSVRYSTSDVRNNYFFIDYLRNFNDSTVIEEITEKVNANESGIFQNISVLGINCLFTISPLIIEGQTKNYYLIQTYEYANLNKLNESILYPLVMLMVLYAIVFLFGIFVVFIFILKRNADIQVSKIELYYNKPYVMKVNKKGKILHVNSSFKKLNIDWKIYRYIYNCTTPDDEIDIVSSINRSRSLHLQFLDRDETNLTFFMVSVKTGFNRYIIGEDVTDTFNEHAQLTYLSSFDKLTGLPNREQLQKDLTNHLITVSKLYSQNMIINSSLVFFDINQLYSFVNIFGNQIANRIVVLVAEMFKKMMQYDEMTLYRISDSSFAMLFKAINSYDDITNWVTSALEQFKKPIEIDENQLTIKSQFGIFNVELDKYENLTSALIFENAEIALAHANSLKSVNYVVYNLSLGRLIKREQLMEEDLKKAIENEEFDVFIQPQFDTNSNRIVSFEALTRWINPKYKNDSPIHFIELAEKNNLIIPIGKIIIEKSFKIAKHLEKYDVTLSVNVSPAQLLQTGFVNQFVEAAEKYKINPGAIAIEITETFLVQNFAGLIEKLSLLRKKGFKIHLDDFGTGYSSMLYLKDLPIDAIKIDKEFIKYINTDKYSRTIVSKVISLAKTLELEIIAEGVEDEKQSMFLNKNGCNIIQGFLISKPVAYNDAEVLLNKYNAKAGKSVRSSKSTKNDGNVEDNQTTENIDGGGPDVS